MKFRTSVMAIAAIVAASFSLFAQAPVRGGDLPAPLPLFPPDNWWNTEISSAPLDSNSSAYINFVGPSRGLHPDFGGDSGDSSAPIYGMPYIIVSGSQPLVSVPFDYDDESDHAAPGRPPGYPIPEEAKAQQKWIEGGLAGGDPNADGDRHHEHEGAQADQAEAEPDLVRREIESLLHHQRDNVEHRARARSTR